MLNANYSSGPLLLDEADRSLEDEVDPDVFAEAMFELDNATCDRHKLKDQCTSTNLLKNPIGKDEQPSTSHKAFKQISTVSQMMETKVQPAQKVQSSCLSEADDLLPPPPKRKPWERKSSAAVHKESQRLSSNSVAVPGSDQSIAPVPAQNLKFHPFCYIEVSFNLCLPLDIHRFDKIALVLTFYFLFISKSCLLKLVRLGWL